MGTHEEIRSAKSTAPQSWHISGTIAKKNAIAAWWDWRGVHECHKHSSIAWNISAAITEILPLQLGGDSRWVEEQEPKNTGAPLCMRPAGLNSSLVPITMESLEMWTCWTYRSVIRRHHSSPYYFYAAFYLLQRWRDQMVVFSVQNYFILVDWTEHLLVWSVSISLVELELSCGFFMLESFYLRLIELVLIIRPVGVVCFCYDISSDLIAVLWEK